MIIDYWVLSTIITERLILLIRKQNASMVNKALIWSYIGIYIRPYIYIPTHLTPHTLWHTHTHTRKRPQFINFQMSDMENLKRNENETKTRRQYELGLKAPI